MSTEDPNRIDRAHVEGHYFLFSTSLSRQSALFKPATLLDPLSSIALAGLF